MVKKIAINVLFVSFLFLGNISEAKYVNSIEDFKTHTQTHIRNVTRLAMYLYYDYRYTLFSDVPEHALRKKLLLHDYEKLASSDELKEFGYTGEPFLNRLYKDYGKNRTQSASLPALITDLLEYVNKVDLHFFKSNYFVFENGSLDKVGQKIMLIEKIADLVDREMNLVSPEEFGVKEMRPASEFFDNERDQLLAKELAFNYEKIVNPNPLVRLVPKAPRAQPVMCQRLFG